MKRAMGFALSLLIMTPLMWLTNIEKIDGKFYCDCEAVDSNGNKDIYYQFKSNDNEVYWLLSKTEIGFIPDNDTEYVLTYNDNGTTKDNKNCDCTVDWVCECYVYDDVFMGIKEKE